MKKKDRTYPLENATDINDSGQLWPSENYLQQIEQLKKIIGQTIYFVELSVTDINVGVHHTDRGYELLDVVEYPRPDPKTNLYPHYILLDDGRGINLGRIEQISTERAFNPPPQNIVYHDQLLLKRLLPHQTRFSHESVKLTSKLALGSILGKPPVQPLENDQAQEDKKTDSISITTGEAK